MHACRAQEKELTLSTCASAYYQLTLAASSLYLSSRLSNAASPLETPPSLVLDPPHRQPPTGGRAPTVACVHTCRVWEVSVNRKSCIEHKKVLSRHPRKLNNLVALARCIMLTPTDQPMTILTLVQLDVMSSTGQKA